MNKVKKFTKNDYRDWHGVEETEDKPALILEMKYFARDILAILSIYPHDETNEECMLGVYGAAPESEDHFYFYICSYEIGQMLMNGMATASHPEIFLMLERNFEKGG